VIAVAANALVFAGDGVDPVIDTSKQALLHFSDPASQIATPGTPNEIAAPTASTFQADLLALRCISRITWAAAPDSVAVVNGATW
jgi:hypothetical protein